MGKIQNVKTYLNNNVKPKTKKGLILGICFGIVLPVTLGAVAGVVINKFFIGKNADYSKIDINAISADVDSIMQKYSYCNDNGIEYSQAMKPYEMVNASYALFSNYSNSVSYIIGYADASMVLQSIHGATIRNGSSYMEESLSLSSFVNVAVRAFMNEDSDIINVHNGEATSNTAASFGDTHYEYSKDEYRETFGRIPSEPLPYIISKKTVLSNSSSVTRIGSDYKIDMDLHPVNSVAKYVKQMKNISNLSTYPAFDSVSLSFILDENLLVKELNVKESYYARTSAGVGSDIKGTMKYLYYVNGNYTIPALNTPINYPEVNL